MCSFCACSCTSGFLISSFSYFFRPSLCLCLSSFSFSDRFQFLSSCSSFSGFLFVFSSSSSGSLHFSSSSQAPSVRGLRLLWHLLALLLFPPFSERPLGVRPQCSRPFPFGVFSFPLSRVSVWILLWLCVLCFSC